MKKMSYYLAVCLIAVMGVSMAQAGETGDVHLEKKSAGDIKKQTAGLPAGIDAASLQRMLDNPPRIPPLPEKKGLSWLPGNDKIDERIRNLLATSRSKSGGALQHEATAKGLHLSENNLLAVALSARSAQELQQLRERVLHANGKVVSDFENTLYAYLPLSAIEQLGREKSLHRLAPQMVFPTPELPPSTSKDKPDWDAGLKLTGADILHKKNIRGKGVKVGILDIGFAGYKKLQEDKVLPVPAAHKVFSASEEPEDEIHGTACAEIVHAMAPDAALYLAEFEGTFGQQIAAVNWLVEQGVDIISYSMGGHLGPHDGTSETDRFADQIVTKNNILWVASAGNEGDYWHFTTMIEDQDRDGYVDIRTKDAPDKILLYVGLVAFSKFYVFANWDDWPKGPEGESLGIDLDLYLFEKKDGQEDGLKLLSSSRYDQNSYIPCEEVIGEGTPEGKFFYLLIKINGKVEQPTRLHLFNGMFIPFDSFGSVGIPATAKEVLAVGAVDVATGKLEKYSSQGKTDDGRLKPEISAPDAVLSRAYQLTGESDVFTGTSAACPHVAGAAALLKEAFPEAGQTELRKILLEHAKATGEPSPNPQYGYGILNLADINPARQPESGQKPSEQPGKSPSVEDVMHELFPVR